MGRDLVIIGGVATGLFASLVALGLALFGFVVSLLTRNSAGLRDPDAGCGGLCLVMGASALVFLLVVVFVIRRMALAGTVALLVGGGAALILTVWGTLTLAIG